MLIDAHDKDLEELLWRQYALIYPGMDEKSFITFEAFKEKYLGATVKLDKEQILKDAEAIKDSDQKGGRE